MATSKEVTSRIGETYSAVYVVRNIRIFQVPIINVNAQSFHQSTAASTGLCGPRPRLSLVEMAVGLSEGPSYHEHFLAFFRYAAP